MLIRRPILDRIAKGEVTLAFRRWRRATVRAGGTLRTAVGVLAIQEVREVDPARITAADVRRAGFASLAELREELDSGRPGDIYRIQLSLAGPDPRIARRKTSRLTQAEVDSLANKLAGFDRRSAAGPWTVRVLQAIANNPSLRAGDLAEQLALEKEWLKLHVRKLKELGLTESLHPGYRLSPRGKTFLRKTSAREP